MQSFPGGLRNDSVVINLCASCRQCPVAGKLAEDSGDPDVAPVHRGETAAKNDLA